MDVIIGTLAGEEGKTKLLSYQLKTSQRYTQVIRPTSNAKTYRTQQCAPIYNWDMAYYDSNAIYTFRELSVGLLAPHINLLLGDEVRINPYSLLAEMHNNMEQGLTHLDTRILISERAILDLNKNETKNLRLCEIYNHPNQKELLEKHYGIEECAQLIPALQRIQTMTTNITALLTSTYNTTLVDVTQAQAGMPYDTVSTICTKLKIPIHLIRHVYGVVKAYSTFIKPIPGCMEMKNSNVNLLRQKEKNKNCTNLKFGWLNIPLIKEAIRINNITRLMLNKIEALDEFEEIKILISYTLRNQTYDNQDWQLKEHSQLKANYIILPGWKESTQGKQIECELPIHARMFIKIVEQLLGKPICWIGTGPQDCDMINTKICGWN